MIPDSVLRAAQAPASQTATPPPGKPAAATSQNATPAASQPATPATPDASQADGGWRALFRRTHHRPAEFRDTMTAGAVNGLLDWRTQRKHLASDCEVGESAALCVAAVSGNDDGGATPAGLLAQAAYRYGRRVRFEPTGDHARPEGIND